LTVADVGQINAKTGFALGAFKFIHIVPPVLLSEEEEGKMKSNEAMNILKNDILSEWLDFDWWATLQLVRRGEYSPEKMNQVCTLHKEREARMKAYDEEEERQVEKMYKAGKTTEEINLYLCSQHDERYLLVKEWRSLY
jgi:hypothetical protein